MRFTPFMGPPNPIKHGKNAKVANRPVFAPPQATPSSDGLSLCYGATRCFTMGTPLLWGPSRDHNVASRKRSSMRKLLTEWEKLRGRNQTGTRILAEFRTFLAILHWHWKSEGLGVTDFCRKLQTFARNRRNRQVFAEIGFFHLALS